MTLCLIWENLKMKFNFLREKKKKPFKLLKNIIHKNQNNFHNNLNQKLQNNNKTVNFTKKQSKINKMNFHYYKSK